MKRTILSIVFMIISLHIGLAQQGEWTSLLDKTLTHWDGFMGVPHTSVEGLAEDVRKGDGMKGIPLGLNNDPLNVFSMEGEDGMPVLHVSGQIYGGLTSKEAYENYPLKLEFKWGEKKWEPRLKGRRNNGLLYHCNGERVIEYGFRLPVKYPFSAC